MRPEHPQDRTMRKSKFSIPEVAREIERLGYDYEMLSETQFRILSKKCSLQVGRKVLVVAWHQPGLSTRLNEISELGPELDSKETLPYGIMSKSPVSLEPCILYRPMSNGVYTDCSFHSGIARISAIRKVGECVDIHVRSVPAISTVEGERAAVNLARTLWPGEIIYSDCTEVCDFTTVFWIPRHLNRTADRLARL